MIALQIPTPYGPKGSEFYRAIDEVVVPNGWKAATVPLGTTFITDPTKANLWSPLDLAVRHAFGRGIEKLIFRLGQDVQPFVYKGGKWTGDITFWSREGRTPDTYAQFRPAPAHWEEIGGLVFTPAIATIVNACKACGKDPAQALALVFFNEPGKGGRGGSNIGPLDNRKYPSEIQDKPDGYIEPEVGKMFRTIRANTRTLGVPSYLVSLESSGGPDGQVELDSIVGPDWQKAFEMSPGYCINHYAPQQKALEGIEALAGRWGDALQAKFERAAKHPILATAKRRAVAEANVMMNRLQDADKIMAHHYRRALVQHASLAPLDFVSIFSLKGVEGCNLVRDDFSPVGGVVRGS